MVRPLGAIRSFSFTHGVFPILVQGRNLRNTTSAVLRFCDLYAVMICDAFTGVFWKLVDYFQNALLASMISIHACCDKDNWHGGLATEVLQHFFVPSDLHAHTCDSVPAFITISL